MTVRSVVPLPTARQFAINEMFFSTTDAHGRILAGNQVFARTSGFALNELVGQPHNLIRHPHMPRAAFATLWSNLRSGRPFNGYVQNMAKNGAYYWVFASICPLRDGRLLSVRFKPTTKDLFVAIPALYAAVLTAEKNVLAKGGTEKAATQEGLAVLHESIRQRAFPSYDEFSEAALNREMVSRDEELGRSALALFPEHINAARDLEATYHKTVAIYRDATELFSALERIGSLSQTLRTEANSVIRLADDFQLTALNTNIASSQFGADGACTSVIASFLTRYAAGMNADTEVVRRHLQVIANSARTINASVAMARLNLEMILSYQAEIATGSELAGLKLLPDLEEAFLFNAGSAGQAIESLTKALLPVASSRDSLAQAVVSIQMAQVRGLTEAARLSSAETLRMMFEEFRTKIEKARLEIDRISDVLGEFASLMTPLSKRAERLQDPLLV